MSCGLPNRIFAVARSMIQLGAISSAPARESAPHRRYSLTPVTSGLPTERLSDTNRDAPDGQPGDTRMSASELDTLARAAAQTLVAAATTDAWGKAK